VVADLSDSTNVHQLARDFPDIEILVNNAGSIPGGTLLEVDEARWRAPAATPAWTLNWTAHSRHRQGDGWLFYDYVSARGERVRDAETEEAGRP
jgi:hypothetical protein